MKKRKSFIILMVFILLLLTACSNENNSKKEGVANYAAGRAPIEMQEVELALTEKLVQDLYELVRVSIPFRRNFYFFSNKELTVSTFDDNEKHYFASILLDKKDFKVTKNKSGGGTFTLSPEAFKKAIESFFGPDVEYVSDSKMLFSILRDDVLDDGGLISFQYDAKKKVYYGEIGGTGYVGNPVEEIYTKLTSAVKYGDTIILTERFIFTEVEYAEFEEEVDYDEKISYEIYADYEMKQLLASFKDVEWSWEDESQLVSIDDYLDKAGTIVYTFKLGSDNEYHLYSSEVKK